MTNDSMKNLRLSIIAALVSSAPTGLGRTAVMKMMFFLQTLRKVPLGYRFSLYAYGPYDKEVLADLATAEAEKRIVSSVVTYSGGSQGYLIKSGERADALRALADRYRDAIDWVVGEFGRRTAGDLEMVGTIIYVDRSQNGHILSLEDLANQVHDIKPHHDVGRIITEATKLRNEGLIQAA